MKKNNRILLFGFIVLLISGMSFSLFEFGITGKPSHPIDNNEQENFEGEKEELYIKYFSENNELEGEKEKLKTEPNKYQNFNDKVYYSIEYRTEKDGQPKDTVLINVALDKRFHLQNTLVKELQPPVGSTGQDYVDLTNKWEIAFLGVSNGKARVQIVKLP